jgi:metal-responsive CopG/Arc/MetJ family transcriptional regulator
MKKTRKPGTPIKGKGRMVRPIQRVNVDLTAAMLEELDQAALDLNVSRQAVIKTLVRQALDRHYLARRAKQSQPAQAIH